MEENIFSAIRSKKGITILAGILGGLFIVGWIILIQNENRIREIDISSIQIADTNLYRFALDNVSWEKDEISISKDYIKISGWLVKPGESVNTVAIKMIFKDVKTEKFYLIPTTMVERDDVTQAIEDGLNYKNCGFSVSIPYMDSLNYTDYELYILYTLNGKQVLLPLNNTLKGDK